MRQGEGEWMGVRQGRGLGRGRGMGVRQGGGGVRGGVGREWGGAGFLTADLSIPTPSAVSLIGQTIPFPPWDLSFPI